MGRQMAASRSTEVLEFFSAVKSQDPDTLNDITTETILHTVPGRIKYPTTTVSESSAVGQRFAEQSVIASVAVASTPNVRTDHFCRVVSSLVDPGLVGRVYRVAGRPASGQVSAARYPVEEVS